MNPLSVVLNVPIGGLVELATTLYVFIIEDTVVVHKTLACTMAVYVSLCDLTGITSKEPHVHMK